MFQVFALGPFSIRAWLIAVAVSSTVFALIVGTLTGWYSWEQQKLRLGQNLVATSRALVQSTDRELEQASVALTAVATSYSFRNGDFPSFARRAAAFLQPYGYFLIVSEPGSSRELVNTAAANLSPLPGLPNAWTDGAQLLADAKVRPLGQMHDGQWAIAVQLIAASDAGSKYLLTLGVPAQRFQQIIDNQRLPPGWSPVILDQHWTIVARAPDKFIGQQGANYQLKDIPPPDSVYEAHVLEGTATIHARSRSDKFGWTTAIAVPQSHAAADFLGPAALAGLFGFLIALSAAPVIGIFSIRLGRDVDALSKAAAVLGEQTTYPMPKLQIRELATVADNMREAANRLETEEKFRKRTVEELAHRLRNKVATIQAIVGYELRDLPEARDSVFERLTALAATDELIIAAQGKGASLAEIVKTELAPYEGSRVSCSGPEIFLEPKLALTMALVLHELATNASKYGAMSVVSGKLAVRWSIADNRLNIEWRETGGPLVVKPERRGFGSRLVTGVLASFGGKFDTQFEPTGLVCNLSVALLQPPPNTFLN